MAGSCIILLAGRVLRDPAGFRPPPVPSGSRFVAIGLPSLTESGHPWLAFHARHGGDYPHDGLPSPLCEWHATMETATARLRGEPLPAGTRVVHWPGLDLIQTDERLHVWQVVTSLQHGGAERIARDLAAGLPLHGVSTRLVTLGKPHRIPLAAPPGTLDFSDSPRESRAALVAAQALAAGADAFHVHLTDSRETTALAASGIPVVATIHNTRAAWPAGWESLDRCGVRLMLACSRHVEDELRAALPGVPVRTVWNGVSPDEFPQTPRPPSENGFTLACIANPRPQKRLELLPAILVATRVALAKRGVSHPRVHLVIAGETAATLGDALASRAAFDEAAARHGVAGDIEWTDGKRPVREVLEACHALVSCSAHEGLSLGHLEALACGRPVIACDTGGTRELAQHNPAVCLLPADAPASAFGEATANVLLDPPASARPVVWRDFTTNVMCARAARFLRAAACPADEPPETIWFVSNNLSTGGAQSSLRRLAKHLSTHGRRVRVALLQEYPEHPTRGRLDLLEHGIDVFVPPPVGLIEAEESVDLILAEMAADLPAAVMFWNAIATHKLLLADALPFTRVFDVSPGEMFYSPLERSLDRPPPGLPCRSPRDYGRLLSGMVVKYAAEAPRAAGFGAPVHLIPNGVEIPPAGHEQTIGNGTAGSTRDPLVFATAARISPQKRLDELLAAFRIALPNLPPCVLRIAGGIETGAEDHARELLELAAGLPVEWSGECHDLAAFHRSADLFVMISDPAGCPNASLEALAAGLPVIATDVGGASEQVMDGLNGRLVPARDPAAFAAAMVELAHTPADWPRMGEAARRQIRAKFTIDRMLRDYQVLLEP